MTIICGIDPGTAIIGYGFIQADDGGLIKAIDFGVIRTNKKDTPARRLKILHDELTALIKTYKPEMVAIEKLYFQQNTTTALAVGQARGVILLDFESAGIPIFEYSPNEVKQAITGYGFADKNQMQEMTKILLELEKRPSPDDAADALAIAITHANSMRYYA